MMMNRSEDEYLHLAHTHCWSSMSQMLCSSKNMNSGISADIRFLIRHNSTSLLFIHLRYIHPQPTWPHHKTIRSQFHSLVWGPQGKNFFFATLSTDTSYNRDVNENEKLFTSISLIVCNDSSTPIAQTPSRISEYADSNFTFLFPSIIVRMERKRQES